MTMMTFGDDDDDGDSDNDDGGYPSHIRRHGERSAPLRSTPERLFKEIIRLTFSG